MNLTDQLHASIDACKIAEILSARGVPAERARRYGEMIVTMCDPAMWDAAIWCAAERLCTLLETDGERQPLRTFHARVRQLHVTEALHAIRGFEAVLTGLLNGAQIAQLSADYQNHRAQILARTVAKRLECTKTREGS